MLNIALFGVPGAGKGTQAKLLAERYHLSHISTGELIRNEIKNGTELGKKAKAIIDRGELLDDAIISDMFKSELKRLMNTPGLLFDGYPRTLKQAEIFDAMLKELGLKLDCMLELSLSEEESTARILKRAEIEGRSDDNLQTVKARFDEYRSKTAPIADHYKAAGLYKCLDGTGTIDDVQKRIVAVLEDLK
ncbi:adenylate kinase [bacterium]|nr:adenylate kinase [bacterium]